MMRTSTNSAIRSSDGSGIRELRIDEIDRVSGGVHDRDGNGGCIPVPDVLKDLRSIQLQ